MNQQMVNFSLNIKTLIIKYQPEYLVRVFNPPFDTLQYNYNGEVVNVPDLSIHYKLKMRDSNDQIAFINEAKMLTGVLDVNFPPTPAMMTEDGNVPPNDSYYNQQWFLLENETYGTQSEKVWEVQNDNNSVTIHINEFANGNISSVNHEDLNGNIVYSEFTDPDNDHFIAVCGVASAVTNNSKGVAGTAYNSKIRLTAASAITDRASHLKDAADSGTRIASFSWNSSADNTQFRNAVEYAFNKGVFMVCSGGNTGNRQTVRYPGNYDNYVMAVAPLDKYGNQPSWATWGPHIDITAPGVTIYTTTSQPNGYGNKNGTSFSAPQVAGIAAILYAMNGNISPTRMRTILESAAIDMGSAGKDERFGWGRINAYEVLPNSPTNLYVSGYQGGMPRINWTASTSPNIDHYELWCYQAVGPPYGWQLLATTSLTYWVDSRVTIDWYGSEDEYCYKTLAVNDDGLKSGFSNSDCVLVDESPPWGKVLASNIIPDAYALRENYPNPFNPKFRY